MAFKRGEGLGNKNNRWIGGRIARICLFCKKEFLTYLSQDKRFCSKFCGDSSRQGKPNLKKRNRKIIKCKVCDKEFFLAISQIEKNNYCSLKCLHQARKGQNAEDKNYQWKGSFAGYSALHIWVKKHLGKAIICDNQKCIYPRKMRGKNKIMLAPKAYNWANISHEYKRDLTDWIQLCISCHALYDRGKLGL